MTVRPIRLTALVLLAVVCSAREMNSCSEAPFEPPGFVLGSGPEDLNSFAAGKLGILLPSFARSYLVVAYRFLEGKPLSDAERQGALRVWNRRRNGAPWVEREGVSAWLDVRGRVCGTDGYQGTSKALMLEDRDAQVLRYWAFGNCYPDSFETAAAQLEDLIARYGASDPHTIDWLQAQDAVFRNCSGREVSLPAPSESTTPQILADRDYQLAAAEFYAGDFASAETAFRLIARNPNSRWRTLAPYLVVRCLVRRADAEWKHRAQFLSQALVEIDDYLRDPLAASFHPAASRLRGIVLKRLDPDRRMPELATIIASGLRQDEFAENLWDLTDLMDLYHYTPGRQWKESFLQTEMVAWLHSFQFVHPSEAPAVIERWQRTRTVPWLVAALVQAHGKDAAAPELLTAAAKFDHNSPAWPTVEYHRLRLLREQSRIDEARAGLDAALGDQRFTESTSATNLLRALRAKVATNRHDFLRFVLRTPFGGSGRYTDMGRLVEEGAPRLGEAGIIETLLPLAEQRAIVDEEDLDEMTREHLAVAVWVRAFLLGRLDVMRQMTPYLIQVAGRARMPVGQVDALKALLAAKSGRDARREATFALLHLPGVSPFLGFRNLGPPDELDHGVGDNWWGGYYYFGRTYRDWGERWDTVEVQFNQPEIRPAAGAYPPAQLQQSAERERRTLAACGSPVSFLARSVLAWAHEAPAEPRIPEMLHHIVVAGRYTAGDDDTVGLIKRAFNLLHHRYGDSEWAAKTPYWYQTEVVRLPSK